MIFCLSLSSSSLLLYCYLHNFSPQLGLVRHFYMKSYFLRNIGSVFVSNTYVGVFFIVRIDVKDSTTAQRNQMKRYSQLFQMKYEWMWHYPQIKLEDMSLFSMEFSEVTLFPKKLVDASLFSIFLILVQAKSSFFHPTKKINIYPTTATFIQHWTHPSPHLTTR